MSASRPAQDPGVAELKAAARAAHLRYVSDRQPGIRRVRTPKGFRYVAPDGDIVTDEETISRIQKLAIPPAYENVWICREPNGHLQAVGRDARGRKQYRYHPRWREIRDETKYGRMLVFGSVLPRIRERVEHDLGSRGLPREKVLAAITRLLETTLARVGNEEYAKANKSFGLTTLRNRHVKVDGGRLHIDFRGKHGLEHHIDLRDRRLAKIVKRLQDLPGQDLFEYLDSDGISHPIRSEDVNAYLREIAEEDVTAKDFRTWAATNLMAFALRDLDAVEATAPAKKNILKAVEVVSKILGNTPAVCRKCYIHPAIFDGYLDGSLIDTFQRRAGEPPPDATIGLSAEEAVVAAYLRQRLSVQTGRGDTR